MPEIISRADAHSQGKLKYFTGQPCKSSGHVAERYVSTGGCLDCLKRYSARFVQTGLTKELVGWNPPAPFHVPAGMTPEQYAHLHVTMQSWVSVWAEHVGILTAVQKDAIAKIVEHRASRNAAGVK